MPTKRAPGRPPAANDQVGEPEMVSRWPKIAVNMRPETKALLDAICWVEDRSVWRVLEDGILLYHKSLTPEQRKLLAGIVAARHAARTTKA